jgi:hypothetical protein
MAKGTLGPRTRKVTLSGPFFDPKFAEAFKVLVYEALGPEATRIAGAIRAKAPVLTGKLAASVKVGVHVSKSRKPWVAIRADMTATRKGTKGDAPRRYGTVPYGVFVDHETGFASETMEAERPALIGRLSEAVGQFVRRTNAARPAAKAGG